MNLTSTDFFPAKLLLFGEYAIINGGKGLAIPYANYGGTLELMPQDSSVLIAESQRHIANLYSHLLQHQAEQWQFEQWSNDLHQGLYFNSNIPQGSGLGSSGALVAALYHRYKRNKSTDLHELKQQLAGVESFFHGTSSGIDPLVSYLQRPVLINKQQITTICNDQIQLANEHYNLFLFDSLQARQTAPLVQYFQQKMTDPSFLQAYNTTLVPHNDACITAFLSQHIDSFFEHFAAIAAFQRQHFEPMIPKQLQQLWDTTWATQQAILKLCGAGGGGFFLGIQRPHASLNFPIIALSNS